MAARLARWFVFGVLVSLIPLAVAYYSTGTGSNPPSLSAVIAQGQLLLISVPIAAAAVGELVGRGTRHEFLKVLTAGGAVITVVFASLYYGQVAVATANTATATVVSMRLFVFGLISSAACVLLAEQSA